ncbi:MAG: cobaltochelatase subunit CobN [Sporomusaceae bacterium]|nr:cobaltochelatase subunit CobN [Sporomusaceae bacterium]
MGILYITNIDRQCAMLRQAQAELSAAGRRSGDDRVIYLSDSSGFDQAWRQRFTGSCLVVISWMGSSRDTAFLRQALRYLEERRQKHVLLATEIEAGDSICGVTEAQRLMLRRYLACGGLANYRRLWLWLDYICRGGGKPEPPQPLLWNGIIHPALPEPCTDAAAYLRRLDSGRPTIGILLPRDEFVWDDLAHQTALIAELEAQGMNVIAVFSYWGRDPVLNAPGVDDAVQRYFYAGGHPVIDVLINTMKFSLTIGRPVETGFLARLGVPVLQAYSLLRGAAAWEQSLEGMTPVELSLSVSLPEFDGVVHSLPLAGKEAAVSGSTRYAPLAERIERLAAKAKKWALLRRKPNRDKKVAIVLHNYPANNASIGSGQGLDTPASVSLLLQRLADDGYHLEPPADAAELMRQLLAGTTNERRFLSATQAAAAFRLSGGEYSRCFDTWPQTVRQQLRDNWGESPGDVFNDGGDLLVPGLRNGNVFISVQPPRGFGEDPAKLYHSPDAAPTHHYLAYYQWLRDVFGADALVHVGTHGSLEWLPGKSAALSECCYPDLALTDLPNIYPYLITIVGEGMQAKRRGAACLIGHLPPPTGAAGTYGQLAELEALLDEYRETSRDQPANAMVVVDLIRQKAAALNLEADVPPLPAEAAVAYIGRLHAYLADLKQMRVRTGLHILGSPPAGEALCEYLLALTEYADGAVPSLPETLAAAYGLNRRQLQEQSAAVAGDGRSYAQLADEIQDRSRALLMQLLAGGCSEQAASIDRIDWVAALPQPQQTALRTIATAVCSRLAPALAQTVAEQEHLLAALSGAYVEPGPAGAPSSGGTDILPTGRNFYGVDPRTLPTQAAWEIGKRLADSLLERFIAEEGRYPESIGMVLWSGANMRSRGQCIAEYFYLLGVRPVWQKGSLRVTGLEVIPLGELKRPRIDATVRISGMFRDSLPAAVQWMAKAAEMTAALAEAVDANFVRKHALADSADMAKQGATVQEAWRDACTRVFGCPPGAYGAGVGDVLETKHWQTADDLTQVYVRWGAHAYGGGRRGDFCPELFRRRLAGIEATVKNEDNRDVHLLNSDDFNAYHGGMIAAVRSFRGQAPRSYCGDSSDRSQIRLRSLQEEFRRIFRAETLNPKYIDGMRRHGYKGAADLAAVVAHCYEWDATSQVMEDWMYDSLAQTYALDASLQDWMRQVNPWALLRLAEKLLEAAKRGMWRPQAAVQTELEQLYLAIEGELEEQSDH